MAHLLFIISTFTHKISAKYANIHKSYGHFLKRASKVIEVQRLKKIMISWTSGLRNSIFYGLISKKFTNMNCRYDIHELKSKISAKSVNFTKSYDRFSEPTSNRNYRTMIKLLRLLRFWSRFTKTIITFTRIDRFSWNFGFELMNIISTIHISKLFWN